MKKRTIITTVILCAAIFTNVSAQDKTSFGIKLNGNLTNLKLSDIQSSKGKFNAGASVGGFVRIGLGEHFSLQPELLLNYTETKLRNNGERLKFKYAGVEIPVYFQGEIKAGNGKVILGIGPHIGYGFSADTKTERLPEGHPGENKIELDHWYAGGGVIAGYEFRNQISLNTGYQLGFDFRSRHKSSQVKTQTISLGIGYRF